VDPCDLDLQVIVADRAFRRRALLEALVRVRSDLAPVLCEHLADRLDPEPFPVTVYEGDYR
jgi:hypothetical protein